MIAEVAVNFPVSKSILSYLVPDQLILKPGFLVRVPLGKREEVGCVIEVKEEGTTQSDAELKHVREIVSEDFSLSKNEIKLYQWMSQYYHYSLGKVIFDCLPDYLKRFKKPLCVNGIGQKIDFDFEDHHLEIIKRIKVNIDCLEFSQHLIHGITGSGKSLIFLKLALESIAKKKSVLFLVPEINLTPQFLDFFKKYLNCEIYSFHSNVTKSQKFNLWRMLKNQGEPIIVIGVRSAVFLPIENLGLIIIDEEHDHSFKQDDRCRYNARDVAIKKAQLLGIPIVLGSATPSMESYYRFKESSNHKLSYHKIEKRFGTSKLPEILKTPVPHFTEKNWPLSDKLIDKVNEALNRGEKIIIYVNKLGFSRVFQCQSCHFKYECPNCTVPLVFYKQRNSLECYICDYKHQAPKQCPKCGCLDMQKNGFGTEKIMDVAQHLWPSKKIKRFDRDLIKTQDQLEVALDQFKNNEIDILIGTQMLSKGHNFKNVTLIIVLGIDGQLSYPDFRVQEYAYQDLTQISGRAGRFGESSEVYIQSNFDTELFEDIINHRFDQFYKREIELRSMLSLPPISKQVKISISSRFQDRVQVSAERIYQLFYNLSLNLKFTGKIHRPTKNYIEKTNNQFGWHFSIFSPSPVELNSLIKTFWLNYKNIAGVSVKTDVDPI